MINYLIDSQVAANISNAIGYANANLAATPLLDASIAADATIYPPPGDQQRLFAQAEVPSEQSRAITRIWQRFKTGQWRTDTMRRRLDADRIFAKPRRGSWRSGPHPSEQRRALSLERLRGAAVADLDRPIERAPVEKIHPLERRP